MKISLCLLMSVMIASCVDVDADLPTAARPVVQAYLTPGHAAEIEVWRETIFLDTDTVINLDNLDITIETGGQRYPLTSTGNGKYSNSSLIIEEGRTYNLSFPYNNAVVTATTVIPTKPVNFTQSETIMSIPTFAQAQTDGFPDPLELTWANPDGKYYLIIAQVAQDNPVQINTGGNNVNRPAMAFRNQPTQANTYSLRPQQFQYYSLYRIILFEVTEEYAMLYQNNGTSSINIKTPNTNVSNGLGIFTGVNSDTLFVRTRASN